MPHARNSASSPGRIACPRSRRRARLVALAAMLLWARASAAAPQWHVALGSGMGWYEQQPEPGSARWFNTLGAHALWGRERDGDVGLGPYLRASHVWGEDLGLAGGASALLPVSPTYPFILSVGGLVKPSRAETAPGFEAWLFWGPSSYNYHSHYSMASGILAGVQQSFGLRAATTFAVALQVDMAWLALPVIALYEWVRGPPER